MSVWLISHQPLWFWLLEGSHCSVSTSLCYFMSNYSLFHTLLSLPPSSCLCPLLFFPMLPLFPIFLHIFFFPPFLILPLGLFISPRLLPASSLWECYAFVLALIITLNSLINYSINFSCSFFLSLLARLSVCLSLVTFQRPWRHPTLGTATSLLWRFLWRWPIRFTSGAIPTSASRAGSCCFRTGIWCCQGNTTASTMFRHTRRTTALLQVSGTAFIQHNRVAKS